MLLSPLPPSFYVALSGYVSLHTFLRQQFPSFLLSSHLTPYDRSSAPLKLVSALHSFFTTAEALRIYVRTDWSDKNLITTVHPEVRRLAGAELAYLAQDTLCEIAMRRRFGQGSDLIMAHHLGFGTGLAAFLMWPRERKKGDFFVAMLLLMNTSTPLLNLRWFLRKRRPLTPALLCMQGAVDLLLVVTFFACRMLLVWHMLRLYGKQKGITAWQALCHVRGFFLFHLKSERGSELHRLLNDQLSNWFDFRDRSHCSAALGRW